MAVANSLLIALPLANLDLWITPLWVLSVGVTIGLVVLAALWGVTRVINPKAADTARLAVSESVLMPALYLGLAMAAGAVFGAAQMPVDEVMNALRRLPSVGEQTITQTIQPRSLDAEVPVSLVADEIQSYEIRSDQDLRISAEAGLSYTRPMAVVAGDEPYGWNTASKRPRGLSGSVDTLYVTNESDSPAVLTFTVVSEVRMPEVRRIPTIAATVVAIFGAYVLLAWLSPNISNIAAATAKEAIGQPLFLLFTVAGAVAMVVYIYVPYNTFGEDVKMLKDSGLSTVMVLAILFAVWTASVAIAEEIEGKTALTLLSKPISRIQFILGKYIGILWPVLLMFVMLGAVLMASVSYKVVYDARETSNPSPDWQLCHAEMMSTTPGLVLAFLETALLTAIAVAISTRLPMLPNLVIVGSVYALGHLTPLIVQSSVGQNEFVRFFGRLVSVVLPMLDHLNIQAPIAAGLPVPAAYLGWAALYTLTYVAVALLVALLLFEDRDLA